MLTPSTTSTHSRRAVWLAANDEYLGPRLTEIAMSHVKLARIASERLLVQEDVMDIMDEIKHLRAERSAIISQFEEA
jgi:hypothetical protein